VKRQQGVGPSPTNVVRFPLEQRRKTPNALLAEHVPMLRSSWEPIVRGAAEELRRARKQWLWAVGRYEKARARLAEPRKRIRRCKGEEVRAINLNFARWELQNAHTDLRFEREMLGQWIGLYYSQPWIYGDEGAKWEALGGRPA
jgi:hypothetical protein